MSGPEEYAAMSAASARRVRAGPTPRELAKALLVTVLLVGMLREVMLAAANLLLGAPIQTRALELLGQLYG
jgi:hypothetical protein